MTIQRDSIKFFGGALLMFAMTCSVSAQGTSQNNAPKRDGDATIERKIIVQSSNGTITTSTAPNVSITSAGSFGLGGTFDFVSTEMSLGGKTIKGAPYSATGVTERTQTLGDGNRIVNKTNSRIYRDSEGRTRREQTVNFIGGFAAENSNESLRTIFINDPVANVNYILNEKDRTARKLPSFGNLFSGLNIGDIKIFEDRAKHAGAGQPTTVTVAPPPPPPMPPNTYIELRRATSTFGNAANRKTESLGKQTIEGVEAEGTRTTTTIPAGKIGNERDIEIVSERWYSTELQTVVMSKQDDPRTGTNVYRLTNITRDEPARTLFEVPSDYTIKASEPNAVRSLRLKKDE